MTYDSHHTTMPDVSACRVNHQPSSSIWLDDPKKVLSQQQSVLCSLFQSHDKEPFEAHSMEGEVRLLRAKEAGISGRREVSLLCYVHSIVLTRHTMNSSGCVGAEVQLLKGMEAALGTEAWNSRGNMRALRNLVRDCRSGKFN